MRRESGSELPEKGDGAARSAAAGAMAPSAAPPLRSARAPSALVPDDGPDGLPAEGALGPAAAAAAAAAAASTTCGTAAASRAREGNRAGPRRRELGRDTVTISDDAWAAATLLVMTFGLLWHG